MNTTCPSSTIRCSCHPYYPALIQISSRKTRHQHQHPAAQYVITQPAPRVQGASHLANVNCSTYPYYLSTAAGTPTHRSGDTYPPIHLPDRPPACTSPSHHRDKVQCVNCPVAALHEQHRKCLIQGAPREAHWLWRLRGQKVQPTVGGGEAVHCCRGGREGGLVGRGDML